MKKVLEKADPARGSNETLLVLIPKEENPASIRGIRPIRFVNVCVKLVTKLLVNRLKGISRVIVSIDQASFVPSL